MVKKITCLLSLLVAAILFVGFRSKFYGFQPPSNYSGAADGWGLCSDCHGNLNSGGGSVTVTGLPAHFQPGQTYPFSVTIAHPTTRARWGFEINARNANGQPVGVFTSNNPNAKTNGGVWELSHYLAVASTGTSYTYNNLFWTAPTTVAAGDNSVTFFVAGNAANGDGNSTGDFIYTNTTLFTLPVTLKTFTTKIVNEQNVELDWTTASESRSKEFVVEKSDDNRTFFTTGHVSAAGQSTSDKFYTFTDNKPSYFDQPVYYRIKLVDEDGSFNYSKTLQVTLKGKASFIYSLSNPAVNQLNVGIFSDKAKKAEVSILSADGRLFSTRLLQLQPGKISYTIPINSLSHGTYFLRLQSNERSQTLAFVKM